MKDGERDVGSVGFEGLDTGFGVVVPYLDETAGTGASATGRVQMGTHGWEVGCA